MSVVGHNTMSESVELIAPSVEDIVDLIASVNAHRIELSAPKGSVALKIKGLISDITGLLDARPKMTQGAAIEVGEGLGEPLSSVDGLRRLQAYATRKKIESWAGEVAGPSDLERGFGISRSTLHDWQKRGAAIGLLAGRRKHVFPLAQFIDGRPIEGLAEVVEAAGSARAAWLWLVEPHPSLHGRKPLEQLEAGNQEAIIDLAVRDFGPS